MRLLHCYVAIVAISLCSCGKQNKFEEAIQISADSINRYLQSRPAPGMAVTVSVNGEVVWSQGFGYADLEQQVPVSPANTKFRIGSISKSLTAAGLAKLYEQNKIQLDSSIYFYLPDFPKKRYRPTVRQVAGHIGGVRHYKGDEWFSSKHYATVSDGLSMFKDDSLMFKPGERYQYSSHGFNLLSAVMEKAAGQSFLPFMKREVFNALGLKNTTADLVDSIIVGRARLYEAKDTVLVNAPFVDNSYKWAGGGFISTSEDINRFGNALLRSDYLKPETIEMFTTPQKLNDGTATDYGIGFFRDSDSNGRTYFGHSGGSVGGTSNMVIYPKEKVVVVIIVNMSNGSFGDLAQNIGNHFITELNSD
jgi:serine beta-lactamase-like protein LACTB, mitochondrial